MRCLTLLAVDDTVAELSEALDALQIADHTYFVYSSDREASKPSLTSADCSCKRPG